MSNKIGKISVMLIIVMFLLSSVIVAADVVDNGECVEDADCEDYNIPGVATCNNEPDGLWFTWDSRPEFTSTCDIPEGQDSGTCTEGDDTVTHACDVGQCDAPCENGDVTACETNDGYSGEQSCNDDPTVCAWGDCLTDEYCGDGIINGPEECDGDNLGETTCADLDGYNYGDLSCNGECEFDTSDCIYDDEEPLVEVISPPDSNPITWYEGSILTQGTVSDPYPSSGINEVTVGYHDLTHTWNDGYFTMIYNPGTGFFEYEWETWPQLCSIVQVDIFGEDNVGNIGADTNQFGVDNEPPTTTKDWTTPYVVCEEEDAYDCDLYVTPETEFMFSAEDCGSGVDEIYYQINDGGYTTYTGPFSLPAGCGQEIWYYAVDLLGNTEETHLEIDNVDDVPPTTEKTFEGLTVDNEPGDNYYLTTDVAITLTATDHSPDADACPVGVDYIHYEIYWKLNEGDEWELLVEEDVYDDETTFYFDRESFHMIVWYAVDLLGNMEEENIQYHAVDETAPTLNKIVGEPKVDATGYYYGDLPWEWYVTQQTPLTITCVDEGPHPVDDVTIHWYWEWSVDGQEYMLSEEFSENAEEVIFSFPEDSWHILHYWCVDALGNEIWYEEFDVVDTQAPASYYDIIGPYYYDELDNLYVDGITEVVLTCEDTEPHPVGWDYIMYKYTVDGELILDWTMYEGAFSFPEESHHILEYYCVDLLGNAEEVNMLEMYVDHTPPTTVKTYGEPFYTDGISDWITSETPITLTPTDDYGFDHDSGVQYTHYRISLVDDIYCADEYICQEAQGYEEWSTYYEPFYVGEDSCHLIEYYSVDNVEKTEETKRQCVYVDNQEPYTLKTVGEPKIPLEEEWDGEENWIIHDTTEITFECIDPMPHPVNDVSVYWQWRYSVEGEEWTEWSEEILYDGLPITFDESSYHEIRYWCVDALGNTEEYNYEIDAVDLDPPATSKYLEGHTYFNEITETMWITQNTEIVFECEDYDIHPSGVDAIYYRYDLDGLGWTDWFLYDGELYFGEDSEHTLEYYCVDNFGNEEAVQTEFDVVDTAAPEVEKFIWLDNERVYPEEEGDTVAVKRDDVIKLCADAHDVKETGEDGVGIQSIWLMWNEEEYEMLWDEEVEAYCYEWTADDCGHSHFYVRGVDLLYNTGEWENGFEVIVDNVPPVGSVLNPHAGRDYYAGKIFQVYAPAVDFGGDSCYDEEDDCPATGVQYCEMYAIDYPFENLEQGEIEDCYEDLLLYFLQTGVIDEIPEECEGYEEEEYWHPFQRAICYAALMQDVSVVPEDGAPYVEYIGQVPYEDGTCNGLVEISHETQLTDTVFLGWKVVDEAGNGEDVLRLAMNPWDSDMVLDMLTCYSPNVDGTPITMNIGELGMVSVDTWFESPVTSEDPIFATATLEESYAAGTKECAARLERELGEDEVEELASSQGVVSGNAIDGYVCEVNDFYVPPYPEIESGSYIYTVDYMINDDLQVEVIGSDWFDLIVDNDRPEMGVISPEEDSSYGELMPVSLYVTDDDIYGAGIAPESVKVRVYEAGISLFGWDFCGLDGCDDTGWITLEHQGNDLYTTVIDLEEHEIDQEGMFTVEAWACDNLYFPCEEENCDDGLGYLTDDTRNVHHCMPISDSFVEERPECNDGYDNDLDEGIDYFNLYASDDGCYDYSDESEEATCGNDYIEEEEACDDGDSNGETCDPEYEDSCDYCTEECTVETLVGGFCGDSNTDEGYETCDNGEANGEECTPEYDGSCDYCTEECSVETIFGGYCGDEYWDVENEECEFDEDCGEGLYCDDYCGCVEEVIED